MAGNCNQKNPLKHSGANQAERYRDSLSPDSAKVDDRELQDLILFAKKYAKYIQYYNPANFLDGHWLAFFANDPTATFASVVKIPANAFFDFYKSLNVFLESDKSQDPNILQSHFKLFFHVPLLLLKEISAHYGTLEKLHPLRSFIVHQYNRDLKDALQQTIAFYKGAVNQGLFTTNAIDINDYSVAGSITVPDEISSGIDGMEAISDLELEADFLTDVLKSDWPAYYTGIAADEDPYLEGADTYEKIYDAINYSLLTNQLLRFFTSAENLGKEAVTYFEKSLEENQEHRPDYALFLTFIQLFKNNQDQLNQITERHLNYYYKDILQLGPKAAVPQKAYLTFELSKNINDHLLKAGTLFKDGKDDLGNEVAFQLDQDIVVNKATVASLKSVFLPERESAPANYFEPFAAENVATSDGLEEPLAKDRKSWPVFGPLEPVTESSMPHARLGFAVSDRKLFMKEGSRIIFLIAELTSTPAAKTYPDLFDIRYTGEDGWVDIGPNTKTNAVSLTLGKFFLAIITLEAEADPIIPYDADTHEKNYNTPYPVLEFTFDFDTPATQETNFKRYTELKGLKFTKISLFSIANNIKDVIVQNDNGIADTSKPFSLFGVQPSVGSSFIIGSKEVTAKPLMAMSISLDYKEQFNQYAFFTKTPPADFKWQFNHLKNGQWAGDTTPGRNMFTDVVSWLAYQSHTFYISNLSEMSVQDGLALENEPYHNGASNGYFKITLGKDFGHNKYIDVKTLALIDRAGGDEYIISSSYNAANGVPLQPYDPVGKNFRLSYMTTIDEVQQMHHLHPFGEVSLKDEAQQFLIPAYENEGELYIGIKNLDPPQKLSLLFQLAEGTSNPLKMPTTVSWHYLKGDKWMAFADQDIDDKTKNLSGSGLVGLSLPDDADTKHTIQESGLHWIRLSVEQDSDALNHVIAIKPQAAQASFYDQSNDPMFPAKTLAPGEISKFKISNPSVKKIEQPFTSFGGRAPEASEDFYVRASERLRHKDRAIQIWDYEHLVLEAFPEIYKVKCINHTEICRDTQNNIIADNELKPGHVLVVTVPDLVDNQLANPLRPYTNKSTLVEIDEFLRKRISPFVRLEVQNPKFEEIQVEFKIAFMPEIGDIQFYSNLLGQSIIQFLSPWAFDNGAEISFGGKIHKSAIINFVEEQEHVDYVKDFKMYHKKDISMKDSDWNKVDLEVIESSVSRTIFVSHETHIIHEI